MKRLVLLASSLMVIPALFAARPPGTVGPDAPGATLEFGKPLSEREPFCQTTMARDPVCVFEVVLVEVNGNEIVPSPNRSQFRLPPGEHEIVVQRTLIGNKGTWRGRSGKNLHWYNKHGHPGAIRLQVREGETYRIFGRTTDDNPFGWKGVARKGG